jgi:hypothetical protein
MPVSASAVFFRSSSSMCGQLSGVTLGSRNRSAMSMLTFYINRGGKDRPALQKAVLKKARAELRALFDKD